MIAAGEQEPAAEDHLRIVAYCVSDWQGVRMVGGGAGQSTGADTRSVTCKYTTDGITGNSRGLDTGRCVNTAKALEVQVPLTATGMHLVAVRFLCR